MLRTLAILTAETRSHGTLSHHILEAMLRKLTFFTVGRYVHMVLCTIFLGGITSLRLCLEIWPFSKKIRSHGNIFDGIKKGNYYACLQLQVGAILTKLI